MAKQIVSSRDLISDNLRNAKKLYGDLGEIRTRMLRHISASLRLSVAAGDIVMIEGNWYVTHAGLLRVAHRKGCSRIQADLQLRASSPEVSRWVFKASVSCCGKSFVGYGDADPGNVSARVRGSELRIAETRAVNRALRKAYAIGICSVEELGSSTATSWSVGAKKMPTQPANGNGNFGGPKLRDRLCQLIHGHRLDANLVKSYAVDFCGTKSLREATRQQIEAFVTHLADWAEKDRNALLCQLNSYLPRRTEPKEAGAA